MYDNPNLNILVLSPGRTGSTLIFKLFSQVTKLTPKSREHTDNKVPLKPKEILHSHNISDINLGNQHTLHIVSKRNIIETTFSSLIGRNTKHWIYYKNQNITINRFQTTKNDFLGVYQKVRKYYEDLKSVLPNQSVVIDYSDFQDNFENLFHILNINKNYYKLSDKNVIPVKTPGSHKEWIINYDEIYEYAQTLNPNPPI